MTSAKPYASREEEEQDRISKAHANVAAWHDKYSGFSGGVRVWSGGEDERERAPWIGVGSSEEFANKIITSTGKALATPATPADAPVIVTTAISPPTVIVPAPKQRKPRHPWLAWLFNLISVESDE